MTGIATANCPVCDGPIPVAPTAVLSELVTCRDCGTELEVTGIHPPSVAAAPMEEEDWGE